jgi:hypothetical protein
MLQTIAEADEFNVVKQVRLHNLKILIQLAHAFFSCLKGVMFLRFQVQEYYADVIPIDSFLFSLNSQKLLCNTTTRTSAALLSVFLAFKSRPSDIRFTASSPSSRALASEVAARLAADDVYDYQISAESPILLILDRKSDPITPLLSQWTYRAMVHELLGLNNGRVLLPDVPEGEVTLCGRDDAFFEEHKCVVYFFRLQIWYYSLVVKIPMLPMFATSSSN